MNTINVFVFSCLFLFVCSIKINLKSPHMNPPIVNSPVLKDILINMFSTFYFRSIDKNRTKSLTEDEWVTGNNAISKGYDLPVVSEAEIKRQFRAIDTDGGKTITLREVFFYIRAQLLSSNKNEHLLKLMTTIVYSIMNPSGRSFMRMEDFSKYLEKYVSHRKRLKQISTDDIAKAFREAIPFHDGRVFSIDLYNLSYSLFNGAFSQELTEK